MGKFFKTLFLFLLLFFSKQSYSQISELFYTKTSPWIGNFNSFEINNDSILRIKSVTKTDSVYTSERNTKCQNAEWNLKFGNTIAFSDSLKLKIYLQADQFNLHSAINGYYVQIGENGNNDAIEIYKQTGTTHSRVFRGINGRFAQPKKNVRLQIITDSLGNWFVYSDTSGYQNYILEGSFNDSTFKTTSWFGIS